MARKRNLEVWEVALIKRMIQIGFKNHDIQSCFNRPERPVNSGRISEIKNQATWAEVEPASHFEVTDYLAKQSRSLSGELDDPKIAPTKAAVEFLVTDTGQIDLATDSPKTSDPEVQSVLYEEIKSEVKQRVMPS